MVDRPTTAGSEPPNPQHPADDTVSLRELYLVWRSGLPLIIAVTVMFALVALAFKLYQGRTYSAQAVVQVVRPRVSNQPGTGLEVSVASVVDSGTYRAIAETEGTLAATADAIGMPEFTELGSLNVVAGPGPLTGDAITLTHRVTVGADAGPETAASVANAWAEATVAAVRELMTAPLETVGERVAADVAAREQAYQEASEAWAEFLGVDEREELRRRLEALVDVAQHRKRGFQRLAGTPRG